MSRWKCGRKTIRNRVKNGLPVLAINTRVWRFPLEDIEAFEAKNAEGLRCHQHHSANSVQEAGLRPDGELLEKFLKVQKALRVHVHGSGKRVDMFTWPPIRGTGAVALGCPAELQPRAIDSVVAVDPR